MIEQIARRALFQFELPIPYRAKMPGVDGTMKQWTAQYQVPALCELDGKPPFADIYWAWNEDGLTFAFDVPERTTPLRCNTQSWWKQDGLRICIDTRDARDARRGTRYCHFFYVLPRGGGKGGRQPIVGMHRMSRATETPPKIDTSMVQVGVQNDRKGYSIEVAIPATCLHGWDPLEHTRIGVFTKIKDVQLGSQTLTVTDDLGWNVDPSTWAAAVLTR